MIKDKLKELRTKNDLSLTAFAKAIGVSLTSASLYESGKQNPGSKTIDRICETFGVDREWLLNEEETEDEKAVESVKIKPVIKQEVTPERKTEKKQSVQAEKTDKNIELSKETKTAITKGDRKMSENQNNVNGFMPVPPMPFAPKFGGKSENQNECRKCDCAKMDEFKDMMKDAWKKNIEMKDSSISSKKELWEKRFANNIKIQETFIESMLADSFALPFAPSITISPKKMMKQLKEFEEMANKHFVEQADSFADFRIQTRKMVYDAVTTAMDNADKARKEAEEEMQETKKASTGKKKG